MFVLVMMLSRTLYSLSLLLVKGKNEITVRYSLEGYVNPIGVAEWEQEITRSLPEEICADLPTVKAIEYELNREDSEQVD